MSTKVQIEYRSPDAGPDPTRRVRTGRVLVSVGLGVNAICTGYLCYHWAGIWWLPPGTGVRPMGLALLTLLNAGFNLIICLVLAAVAVSMAPRDFKTGILAILMVVLGLTVP